MKAEHAEIFDRLRTAVALCTAADNGATENDITAILGNAAGAPLPKSVVDALAGVTALLLALARRHWPEPAPYLAAFVSEMEQVAEQADSE